MMLNYSKFQMIYSRTIIDYLDAWNCWLLCQLIPDYNFLCLSIYYYSYYVSFVFWLTFINVLLFVLLPLCSTTPSLTNMWLWFYGIRKEITKFICISVLKKVNMSEVLRLWKVTYVASTKMKPFIFTPYFSVFFA